MTARRRRSARAIAAGVAGAVFVLVSTTAAPAAAESCAYDSGTRSVTGAIDPATIAVETVVPN